jgi:hypothetical protein
VCVGGGHTSERRELDRVYGAPPSPIYIYRIRAVAGIGTRAATGIGSAFLAHPPAGAGAGSTCGLGAAPDPGPPRAYSLPG